MREGGREGGEKKVAITRERMEGRKGEKIYVYVIRLDSVRNILQLVLRVGDSNVFQIFLSQHSSSLCAAISTPVT